MQNLSDRIKAVREKLGVTQVELAKILNCSEGKIKNWEHGRITIMKSRDSLLLSEKFGFNREWLESGTGDMMPNKSDLLLEDIAILHAMVEKNISFPYFKNINASAGYGCYNSECKASHITLSADIMPAIDYSDIEAIKVSGNSMTGTIEDESIIFVDKKLTDFVEGKIYVVYFCEEVYVKRLFLNPKTKRLIIRSDNPVYPEMEVDCEDFRIIGRVVANMQISKL